MKKLIKKIVAGTMFMVMTATTGVQMADAANSFSGISNNNATCLEAQIADQGQHASGQVTVDTTGAGSVYHTVTYQWTTLRGGHNLSLNLQLDYNLTCAYRHIKRTHSIDFYTNYIYDDYNSVLVKTIADYFRTVQAQYGYNDRELVDEVIHFVQTNIRYQRDIDGVGVAEFEKYPIETLYEGRGDCEDTSILLAALIRQLGYASAIIFYDTHAAVGISCEAGTPGTYYNYNGRRYYYVETTAMGWTLGQMPDGYYTKSAQILSL